MPFRRTYSAYQNEDQARAEASVLIIPTINNLRLGRAQGLRRSNSTGARPVSELGTPHDVEIVPGKQSYNGSLQSITIRYGDLTKRLASMAGGKIEKASKAHTIHHMPEFDLEIIRAAPPTYNNPELFADFSERQDLTGKGGLLTRLFGCCIVNYEQSFSINDALVMESVSFIYVNEEYGDYTPSGQPNGD
ncbi:MAG: hypothetical protein DDT26_01749 [Dehalococcoidia bacterium]|nr:hypothetical protein [Chloroflexota bacterium]